MRRGPSGDWNLPGGALAFVLVLLALSIAADALGQVTYVDPAGWRLTLEHERTEAELQDFRDRDERYQANVHWKLWEFNLAREIATTPGTYIEGWIVVPDGVSGPSFSPVGRWLAVNRGGTSVPALRMLFTESGRHNRFVYDTSKVTVTVGGKAKLSQDDDGRYFVILHFPEGTTGLGGMAALVYEQGGGDFPCVE